MARRSEEREWKRPCGREGESRRRRGAAEGGRRAEREGAKEARDEFFFFHLFLLLLLLLSTSKKSISFWYENSNHLRGVEGGEKEREGGEEA